MECRFDSERNKWNEWRITCARISCFSCSIAKKIINKNFITPSGPILQTTSRRRLQKKPGKNGVCVCAINGKRNSKTIPLLPTTSATKRDMSLDLPGWFTNKSNRNDLFPRKKRKILPQHPLNQFAILVTQLPLPQVAVTVGRRIEPLRHALIVGVGGPRSGPGPGPTGPAHVLGLLAGVVVLQPRMEQNVLRGYPLLGFAPQQRPDHAACLRGEAVRHGELAAANLGEQGRVLRVVEGVSGRGRERQF